jgi:hypothetical protein
LTRAAVAVFLALVCATFGAFFAAQRLKGAAPVVELRGAKQPFSPNGDHVRDRKRFGIAVRDSDQLVVDIVDAGGNEVRRLADGLRVEPYRPGRLRWDGRTDSGVVAPDGFYRVRVSMRRSGRSVIVPAKLRIDTRPPRPFVREVLPAPIVAPGTGGILVRVARVSRVTPTRVRVWRTDVTPARPVVESEIGPGLNRWRWDGKVGGQPAPPGTYLVQVAVRDQAGNAGRSPRRVRPGVRVIGKPGLTVRALAAEGPSGAVTAGQRVSVGVDSRRRPYTWSLRRVGRARPVAKGRQTGPRLNFKAPAGPSGLYLLELRSAGSRIRVPILVQATTRAKVLVVVPALTWLGRAAVDDGGDGLPDTLDGGGPVRWPRVLTGLPAGLADDVAPLLVFLDRAKVPYDLTSDLDLTVGNGPRATDRAGVLLLGAQRWAAPAFARRLRRYVVDGGRLATIGTDSLRRGVTVLRPRPHGAGKLVRPTQPIDRDPFGARLRALRELPASTVLRPITGSADAPLLAFWDGTLEGFTAAEESDQPAADDRVKVLAGVGVEPVTDDPNALPAPPRPAITASELGKGVVIRIGLPGWSLRLGADPDVAQLTRNAWDVLAGNKPKPRALG